MGIKEKLEKVARPLLNSSVTASFPWVMLFKQSLLGGVSRRLWGSSLDQEGRCRQTRGDRLLEVELMGPGVTDTWAQT